MVQAVLFDLGDTLLDFAKMDNDRIAQEGASGAYERLRKAGCKLPSLNRYRRANIASIRWALIRHKLNGREFNGLPLMWRQALRWGAPNNEEFMWELAWDWYKPVVPHSSIEPDLIETLIKIRAAGLKIGIVSNTFIPKEMLDKHLEMMGLLEHLPVRIYSSEIGFRKPHPVIFYRALAAVRTRPQDTLFVGDVIKNDIVGAARLGMRTAWKPKHGDAHLTSGADFVIRRISDLMPILLPGNDGRVSVAAAEQRQQ
jgi:FMN phosphatase YigB (HAD superfamily)